MMPEHLADHFISTLTDLHSSSSHRNRGSPWRTMKKPSSASIILSWNMLRKTCINYPRLATSQSQLLTEKHRTGATSAYVFNHVVRAHTDPSSRGIQDALGRWQEIPSSHPHVDYASGTAYIEGTKRELNLPPQIVSLFDTSSRFAVLGLWRPLKTVRRDPLAVCDATSAPDSDYQVRLREFSRTGIKSANYVMSHGREEEQHMWYYMSDMQPDEMVIFKGYDTKQDQPGWRCPHTAFRLPGSEEELPRQSIEARVVCFWN